jgi:tellurite resistance protein TerC
MQAQMLFWLGFLVIYGVAFFIDMFVTKHRTKDFTIKSALRWSILWISIAMLYGLAILFYYPQNPDTTVSTSSIVAMKYFSGYFTEYSLSIDNLFVFIMIFSLMGVAEKNQPRLLKLGILLSIVLRIMFIVAGMHLLEQFHFVIYFFGAVLLWTAYKMAFTNHEEKIDPSHNILYKAASRLLPLDPDPSAAHFFRKHEGRLFITNVLLVFLVIGSTDVLFAVDSIPAIFGVIKDGTGGLLSLGDEHFIAVTSNTFAVMGLVSLYFALKCIIKLFRFLKHGVSFILFFIGAKMIITASKPVEDFFHFRPWITLTVIVSTLAVSILVSVLLEEKVEVEEELEIVRHQLEDLKNKDEHSA